MRQMTVNDLRRKNRRRNRKNQRRKTRNSAAREAIEKTGDWQKVLRERIEGLSYQCFSDGRKSRPKLALSSGRGGSGSD